MPKLSVIIIAKNEAHNIARCLRSVYSWVDEIIVLDSGSTDETVRICHQYTSLVYITDWPGYGPQKNRALQMSSGNWVLSLDADEWVTKHLRNEIQQAIQMTSYQAFYLPRLTMYCGKFQRYGDAAKDKVLRLFCRESGRFTDDIVHEKVISNGPVGYLQQPLLHNAYRSITEWSNQMQIYALLTAQLRHSKGRRSNPFKAYVNSLWAFFRTYLLRQGFRDGYIGFMFAILSTRSSYTRNMQLWRLGLKSVKQKSLT